MHKPTLLALSLLVLTGPAFAQFECTAKAPQNVTQASLAIHVEQATSAYKAREAAYQAGLERRIKELTDTGAWSAADAALFFTEAPRNAQILAQQKQVEDEAQLFATALALASSNASADPQLVCDRATETIALLSALVASSDRQWEMVEAIFQNVAKAMRERKG